MSAKIIVFKTLKQVETQYPFVTKASISVVKVIIIVSKASTVLKFLQRLRFILRKVKCKIYHT